MDDLLRRRVQHRLDALGINPFEAERRAHLKRGYVNDLLIGKKTTFREKALPALAAALECDLDFLRGRSDTPQSGPSTRIAGETAGIRMPIDGIAEAGAWRDPQADDDDPETAPIPPDPRFPADRQSAFLVRGDHAAGLRITGGSIVLAVSSDGYRDGDIVVARRLRADGLAETSIRVIAGGALSARPAKGEIPTYPRSEAEIIGRVVRAVVLFGEAH